MGAALALLGTVLALLVPVLSRTTGLRESVDRREVALSAVANLLERAALLTKPTPEALQPIADQLAAETNLTAPTWKIVVTPESAPPLNRVVVSLSWQGSHEVRSEVSLVRWFRGGTP
jgi:type II secretory pathway pseudopilin PulG